MSSSASQQRQAVAVVKGLRDSTSVGSVVRCGDTNHGLAEQVRPPRPPSPAISSRILAPTSPPLARLTTPNGPTAPPSRRGSRPTAPHIHPAQPPNRPTAEPPTLPSAPAEYPRVQIRPGEPARLPDREAATPCVRRWPLLCPRRGWLVWGHPAFEPDAPTSGDGAATVTAC